MLRELGGGFGRHHWSPSVRTASYGIAKPSVFFDRIQIIKHLRGHRNAVYCAIFDKNGQHVITGSDDRLVKIWSMETGFCLRSCRGHEGDITDLAVNSSNNLVASASNDFTIRVWNLQNGFPVSVLRGHGGAVTAVAFSPREGCGHHLLSSSDDGTCRIWDARNSSADSLLYTPHPKEPQAATRRATPQAPTLPPMGNRILCCSFNADGSMFVTGSSDKIARVWNPCKRKDELTGGPNFETDVLQGHENDVNYVQFSGCAALTRPCLIDNEEDQPRFKNSWSAHDSIVTCSRDGTAIIWKPGPRRYHAKAGRWVKAYHLRVPPPAMPPQPARPGGLRQRLRPTRRGVNMIVWSLDNRFVLAAIMDCRICVWNAVDGSLVHSLTGHVKQTYVLDVHPFNPRIAMSAGYDGRVIIWDLWEGRPIRIYETGDYNLVDGNFSPDGSSLVVSDEVGQIYLFATGEGNSQKHAKYDQFFLGDFRPLVRDMHGNVLDQETQVPPHLRNIQDLLCDASMIPYAEPYQTIYQQRRLGAMGINWEPPTMDLQIGILDDLNLGGPLDPPGPVHAAGLASPHSRGGRALNAQGGQRLVHLPNEVDETMDWEQEVVGLTEDSGSDYSASEESEDMEEKADGDTLDEVDTEEGEQEDDEDSLDMPCLLRRSSRNKRKEEVMTYLSSRIRLRRRRKRKRYIDLGETQGGGKRSFQRRKVTPSRTSLSRRAGASSSRVAGWIQPESSTRPKRQAAKNALHLFSSITDEEDEEVERLRRRRKRKECDGGEGTEGGGRRSLRRRKVKPSKSLPSRRAEASSSRLAGFHQQEPSTRPKRQAARNALHLFSSINDHEDDEVPSETEKSVSRHSEKDSGSGGHRRVLRSRNRDGADEPSNLVQAQAGKVESSDEEKMNRSRRKLVVKFLLSRKVECEDSKLKKSEELPAETRATDCHLEDSAGTSENAAVTNRSARNLVLKHPRSLRGGKRRAAILESSEDSHQSYHKGNENEIDPHLRKLGSLVANLRSSSQNVDSEDFQPEVSEELPAESPATHCHLQDSAGTSENAPVTDGPAPKLIIKHPRSLRGVRRRAAILDSSEDSHHNHQNGNENGTDTHLRKLGSLVANLRSSSPHEGCESKSEMLGEPPAGTPAVDCHRKDDAGTSENAPFVDRPARKLVIKHPGRFGGVKSHAAY